MSESAHTPERTRGGHPEAFPDALPGVLPDDIAEDAEIEPPADAEEYEPDPPVPLTDDERIVELDDEYGDPG